MDETSPNARPTRTRVLRAADVIPPFNQGIEPPGDSDTPKERPMPVPPEPKDAGQSAARGLVIAASRAEQAVEYPVSRADVAEIPSYDLAANILAEQRRVASRRRRAPGLPDDRPVVSATRFGSRVPTPEPLSPNLMELQQVVAEIVARDIERLCRRPPRPLPV